MQIKTDVSYYFNYIWLFFEIMYIELDKIHSETLKIAPQEKKNVLSRNFAAKKKNMSYANDPSLVTMRMTVRLVEALKSGRERHINLR